MRPVLSVLLLMTLALALLGWLILGQGIGAPLVPAPDAVVDNFLQSLSARRYEAARRELSDELKSRFSAESLRQLDEALAEQVGIYEPLPGGKEQAQGARARVEAQIETELAGVRQAAFEMERNPATGLWEIVALEDLLILAERGP